MAYAVVTKVQVKPGAIDGLAELFDQTNRELVAAHPDWLGAWFTADRETNVVTVIARWTAAESYARLRNSDEFQTVMGRFAEQFAGPPEVSVNEILVEM